VKLFFRARDFCMTCHGIDGRGYSEILGLVGKFSRQNFADKFWQAARKYEELLWILKNGRKGTAVASFVSLVMTEEV
jgi:hypothetical protein